jgi:hypothetical protein
MRDADYTMAGSSKFLGLSRLFVEIIKLPYRGSRPVLLIVRELQTANARRLAQRSVEAGSRQLFATLSIPRRS